MRNREWVGVIGEGLGPREDERAVFAEVVCRLRAEMTPKESAAVGLAADDVGRVLTQIEPLDDALPEIPDPVDVGPQGGE